MAQEVAGPKTHELKCIIKLGGAACTHKAQLETPNAEVIHAVAQAVAAAFHAASAASSSGANACNGAQPPLTRACKGIVLVHGAGSFGHHQACEYGVQHGWASSSSSGSGGAVFAKDHEAHVRRGFALTRASVLKLNGLIVDALVTAGLPAVGLSPMASGWATSGRAVVRDGCAAVRDCLRAGLLPVLHGDCVLDEQLGCTILSGDTVMRRLAEVMGAEGAVFLTNVPGVFDRPPEQPGAVLLEDIWVQRDGSWRVPGIQLSASALDATGGIAKKVEEAAVIAALGVDVVIAQAGSAQGHRACFEPAHRLRAHEAASQARDSASSDVAPCGSVAAAAAGNVPTSAGSGAEHRQLGVAGAGREGVGAGAEVPSGMADGGGQGGGAATIVGGGRHGNAPPHVPGGGAAEAAGQVPAAVGPEEGCRAWRGTVVRLRR